jgi:hypothetical protein
MAILVTSDAAKSRLTRDFPRLVVIMLGRLRLSATDAITKYETLAQTVFPEKEKQPFWQDGTFKASLLEKVIKDVVNDSLGAEGPDALMCPPEGSHQTSRA